MTRLLSPDLEEKRAPTGRAMPRCAPYVAIAVVAFLARLLPTLRGGGLLGIGVYDDGVHFTAAAALLAGRTPYADFVLLHPPGIAVALTPFALLGRLTSDPTGFAVARLAFMAIGAVNAVLVALLARRSGMVAAVVSGVFYALWFPATYWESRTTIETIGTLLVLLCLLLLLPWSGRATGQPAGRPTRRAVMLAGVLLGLSAGMKIWAVVPIAVILLWHLVVAGRASALRLAGGVVVGAGVLLLPFFAMAPGPMLRMVVADQLGRPRMSDTTAGRLKGILNVGPYVSHASGPTREAFLVVALLVVAAAAAAAWTRVEGRLMVLLTVATTIVVLVGPTYFQHYAAFPAPFLAVVVGVGVGVAMARANRAVSVTGLAAVVGVLAVAAVLPLSRPLNAPFPGAHLGRLAGGPGCVVADDPTALILMDVLSRDLSRGCPQPVDFTGQTYDRAAEKGPGGQWISRSRSPRWQRMATEQLTAGSSTVLARMGGDGLSRATKKRLGAMPVLAAGKGYVLLGR